MKDIEKFIRENREAFDSYEPGERVLKNLGKEFCPPPGTTVTVRKLPWLKWSAAAAILIFVTAGVVYLFFKQ